MGLSWSNCIWQFKVASLLAVCAAYTASGDFAQAQITPDSFLGVDRSMLTPNVSIGGLPAVQVDGGAIRGTSLFHSFQEFNVGDGQRVLFTNPGGIENIFSRVTGTNPSTILGTLGVNGGANLFLLNPNGIIFGPNARLDLRGSFLASTAQSIKFNDGIEFSTTNPSAPPFLTLNVPIGLQYGQNAGRILVQGQGNELRVNQETGEVLEVNRTGGLEVDPGQTLALAGGEVVLKGGSLSAESGRVAVWSVQGEGLVGLTPTNPGWELTNKSVQNFQDILLSQTAAIDTSGVGGGNIQMQGRRVALQDGSFILSLTRGNGTGGTLSIRASESIEARGNAPNGEASSFFTETIGLGKAGDVELNTKKLILQNGAQVSSSTFNQGNGGKIIVNASDLVEATGITATGNFASGLFSVARNGTGEGGTVEVTTKRLVLRDGAQVSATTFSQGRGGNVLVNASESVEAIGIAPIGSSGLFAASQSTGEGGTVEIDTGKLILQDGAQVSTLAFSQGNGGDVFVNARKLVEVIGGIPQNGNFVASSLLSQTQGTGNSGRVEIHTGKLILQNGGQVSAATFNQGSGDNIIINARESVEVIGIAQNGNFASSLTAQTEGNGKGGTVEITTGKLILKDGGLVSVTASSQGNGGDILVNARELVEVMGIAQNGNFASSLTAQTEGSGKGGTVEITTGKLILQNGGQVSSRTINRTINAGSGGDVLVNAAESVEILAQNGRFISSLDAQTLGTGNGGNITVNTGRLIIQDGARVNVRTTNVGSGGNIFIDASEVVIAGSDSGLRAQTQGSGNAGTVTVKTSRFLASKGAQILAAVFPSGTGKGGNINIHASEIQLTGTSDNGNPTIVFATTGGKGDAGEIKIDTARLIVQNGAQIGVGTFSSGQGGNVLIKASDSIELIGTVPQVPNLRFFRNQSGQQFPSGLFTGSQGTGTAGKLRIESDKLTLRDGATIGVNNQGLGDAGNLEVAARNLLLDNQAVLSATTTSGQGGNMTLQIADILLLRRNSQISTTAGIDQAGGDGGNILIDSGFIVAVPNENSDITANAFQGQGGNININARSIFNLEQRPSTPPNNTNDIDASSQFGLTGTVTINTPDIDPSRGLVELPSNFTDASQQIVSSCNPGSAARRSSFTVTGRGGISRSPIEPFQGDVSTARWITLDTVDADQNRHVMNEILPSSPPKIVEVQGWIVDKNGNVSLVAQVPNTTPRGLSVSSGTCS
ncbi:filamentous haemagglutinin family N-terminal domain protein [Nostoc sp. PCC 7524]|uniref:two-partner secretion domain-containing protein n=1 Tax=Nostoc sp. (strain ATCC 29411 / PCC 7524) TaxID=28072 RepID=UPI00029ECFF4|nr:filamentous hemagglutinin N-terminal domain-containing protein [Nostoc sp. PCC 7524]AFY47535.1 filamentous haemagglutinin family N-terminal domain protein [Nostoc sp. PCC 7524]